MTDFTLTPLRQRVVAPRGSCRGASLRPPLRRISFEESPTKRAGPPVRAESVTAPLMASFAAGGARAARRVLGGFPLSFALALPCEHHLRRPGLCAFYRARFLARVSFTFFGHALARALHCVSAPGCGAVVTVRRCVSRVGLHSRRAATSRGSSRLATFSRRGRSWDGSGWLTRRSGSAPASPTPLRLKALGRCCGRAGVLRRPPWHACFLRPRALRAHGPARGSRA